MANVQALLSLHSSSCLTPLTSSRYRYHVPRQTTNAFSTHFKTTKFKSSTENHVLTATKLGLFRKPMNSIRICKAQMKDSRNNISDLDERTKKVLQVALWGMEGIYIWWLFLLPYAPGDPVWAIKPDTIKILLDLSLNFFFILPFANTAGFHLMEAPVIHPTTEALFNFVIGWTLMFAPLLFTDRKRDRFGESLESLWSVQMFLTNTVLIPYMAIRLNERSTSSSLQSQNIKSGLQSVMTSGARIIGIVGGLVGGISVVWALFGRPDAGFGSLADRWDFFVNYLKSDRPAYAFIWDICLYAVFQPWLIGDNLDNVDEGKIEVVQYLRFVPYMGLVAYLWGLAMNED